MIYTVTFNPSLDYIVSVNDFKLGMTNRTESELLLAGGKGINVSILLKNLEVQSTAIGFIAGFVGDEIQKRLMNVGVNTDFIALKNGISRINVKLQSIEGTEINGSGPHIDQEEIDKLFAKLKRLSDGDVLVLAGSIPASLPSDMYELILEAMADRDILTVVDATGKLLQNVLHYHPFLIKPNNHELGELFGVEIHDKSDVIHYAKELQKQGARNVLVSMAGDGAVLVAESGEVYVSKAPKGKLVNGVGAGDSMVAGFMAGWLEKKDYKHAFSMGISSGSASAFSEYLATKEEIQKVFEQLISDNLIESR